MTKPTDTNQAGEPFELCKEVYERTKWETTDWYDLDPDGKPVEYLCTTEDKIDENDYVPFYTSDYLLEKLPNHIYLQHYANDTWHASQLQPTELRTADNAYQSINASSDTPLKALLKLCLALKEAGEL